MSKQIDERVVEMTFDNKDFEKNVATSMSTIDKLKAALNFKGAEKGLNSINSAAKNVNLSGVSDAVDKVRVKFDALQVAGTTALVNITNAALNTGKRMASAFTIDPIVQGFGEYETQLNSVQTIMANTASKGTTIDQVTDALNELNTYADKTIYNFTEMTRNIGTFTAAGVDLDKSVASIKGIANLAAMSGSSATQAATAMYQLSQAIAAGRVSLMDWNSVVNAGMGGEQFQEALKRTARVMGTGVDAALEKYGSFRESLTQGQWLTTDVLTETLKQISGAYSEAELMQQGYSQEQAKAIANMAVTAEEAATKVKTFTQMIDTMKEAVGSGWAQTWQTVFGDFYEARDFWTSISDMFGDMIGTMSDARNTLLEGAFESSWEQIRGKIEATGGSLDLFDEKIREVVTEAGINYDDLIAKTGDLSTAIQDGAINMEAVQEAFIRFVGVSGDVNKNLPEIEASFNSFSNTVKDIWRYGFDDSADKIEELTRAGYDYAEVSDLVKKITNGEELAVSDLTEAQLKAIGVTDEQMTSLGDLLQQLDDTDSGFKALFNTLSQDSGRVLFLDSIRNLLDAIIKPLQAVSKAWHNVFSIDSSAVYDILEGFNHFTESLIISNETSEKLTRTFQGLFSVLSIITNFVGGGLSAAFQIVQTVLDHFDLGILDVTAGLGDMLTAFSDFVNSHNIFTAAIQIISNVIVGAIIAIQDFIDMVRESEIITVIAENISAAFDGIRSAIEGIAGKGMELLGKFVDLIMSLSDMSFDEIIQAFKDFGSEVFDYLVTSFSEISKPIQEAISNIATFANEKFAWIIDILIRLKDTVVEVVSTIIERFSGTGLAGVFAIVFSAGTLALISKFITVFSKLASPIEAAVGLIDGLKASFEKYAKAKAFTEMSEGIRNIAISIGIMAAAVVALAQLQPEQLMNASIAVGALAVALIAITGALTFLTSKGGFGKLGVGIAAIGAGILMVATSFRVLEGIDEKSMEDSLHSIVSVMIVMTTLAIALQKFGGKGEAKEFGGPALQIIALAAAVAIVANAVKSMAELDQASMTTAIFGMITVFSALTGLMAIMNRFGGGLKNASGLLVMVIGLQAFLLVVGQLANFDASGIIANLPSILVLFGMIAALMAASSLAGANSAKGGLGLIGISASMLIITQVINILGSMDSGVLQRGTAAVVAIGTIMSLLIAATHLAGDNSLKAGGSLILISTAAIILTGAVAILGSMDPAALARGIAAITAIGAIFAGLIAVTHLAKECQKELIVMTVAIGILVGAVVLLSALDPAKLVPATACLTALMMAFGGMAALTKFTGKANSGMIAALGVIVVLAGVVALLGGMNMEGAIAASASITILMLGMSAALLAMGQVKMVSTDAIVAMYALTGVVALLAIVMGALTALDVAPSIETAASMSVMLLTMTAVLAALAAIGPFASLAIPALGALAAVIVGLGALFTAIGALNGFLDGGLADTINQAAPVMQAIGNALGSLIGGLIGGMAAGAMSALPQIGMSISQFWMNIQPFIVGMEFLGPEALNGVKTLVEMLTAITAGNIFESVAQWLTGGSSMDQFAVNLQKFGTAISAFSTTLSAGNFNGETVTAAANAGKALAEMQSMMQGEGGIFTMFEGVKDMEAFGKQIVAFGDAMVDFSDSVDGKISESAVTAASNAGKTFAELQKAIGPTGGNSVLEFLGGTKNLGDFGGQVKAFGDAMVEFSDTVEEKGISEDAVNDAKNAGEIMAALEDSIDTTSGGVVGFFAGETNLADFGTQIKNFGTGLVDFSKSLTENGGIDTEAITKAKEAGVAMSELANSLPDYAFGSGKLDLTGFGNDLTDYAGSLSRMSSILADVDLSKVNLATTAAKKVSEILTSLQGVDESVINKFWVLENLGTSLNDFASDVANLDTTKISSAATAASRIADLINSMTGIDASSVSGFTSAISALGQVSYDQIYSSFSSVDFSLIGVNVMTRLSQGIEIGAQNVQAKLNIVLQSLSQFATTGAQGWSMSGLRLATEFATGIQNGAQNVQAQVQIMVQSAADALNGYEGFFYAAGSNLAVGFANGISASSYRATLASRAMANAAKTAAEQALDEHSPSKVMQQIGEYAGEGFVIGIGNYISLSENVGQEMANAVALGASTLADSLDRNSSMASVASSFRELSDALSGNKEETEEAEEKTSKLADALTSMADSVDTVISRKNDLKSIGSLISRTGVTFTESFVDEMIDSSGQFAGAITEMANLTDEQLQQMVDAFTETEISSQIDELISSLNGDDSIVKALDDAGINIADFTKNANDFGYTLDDVSSKVTSFVDSISDGFSKLSIEDQGGMDEFTSNLNNNIEVAEDWYDNVTKVFDALSIYPDEWTQDFKKEILDGGLSKYGQLISEMADSSSNAMMEVVRAWNTAQQYGTQLGVDLYNSVFASSKELGENVSAGIQDGVETGSAGVSGAVSLMCDNVTSTVQNKLQMHSPSRVMADMGKNIVAGLSQGIRTYINDVKNASIDLANLVVNTVQQALDNHEFSVRVTISPVVDTTAFEQKLQEVQSKLSISSGSMLTDSVLGKIDSISSALGQNGSDYGTQSVASAVDRLGAKIDSINPDNFGVTYQQNNYSPKALSTATIYRQTRNQISLFRDRKK